MWASFSHTAYYEDTKYDYASMVIPLPKNQGIGVSNVAARMVDARTHGDGSCSVPTGKEDTVTVG